MSLNVKSEIKRFILVREEDESGVSGTGTVAEGVIWTNGTVHMKWLSQFEGEVRYPNLDTLIHIHGHGGKTKVVFYKKDKEEPENEE